MDIKRRNGDVIQVIHSGLFWGAFLLADVFRDVGVGPMKMLGCEEVTA